MIIKSGNEDMWFFRKIKTTCPHCSCVFTTSKNKYKSNKELSWFYTVRFTLNGKEYMINHIDLSEVLPNKIVCPWCKEIIYLTSDGIIANIKQSPVDKYEFTILNPEDVPMCTEYVKQKNQNSN